MSVHTNCPMCKCEPKKLVHEHRFNDLPSYVIRFREYTKKVWVCANKDGSYCHESKEEHVND